MAFSQAQKKLLIKLTHEPEKFLLAIKGNKNLKNSFAGCFFQNGDGIYHLIFNAQNMYLNENEKKTYREIFDEFFYFSNASVFQHKSGGSSAVSELLRYYEKDNLYMHAQFCEMLTQILDLSLNEESTLDKTPGKIHLLGQLFQVLLKYSDQKLLITRLNNLENEQLLNQFSNKLAKHIINEKTTSEEIINIDKSLKVEAKNLLFELMNKSIVQFEYSNITPLQYLLNTFQFNKMLWVFNNASYPINDVKLSINTVYFSKKLKETDFGVLFQQDLQDTLLKIPELNLLEIMRQAAYRKESNSYLTVAEFFYTYERDFFNKLLNSIKTDENKGFVLKGIVGGTLSNQKLDIFLEHIDILKKPTKGAAFTPSKPCEFLIKLYEQVRTVNDSLIEGLIKITKKLLDEKSIQLKDINEAVLCNPVIFSNPKMIVFFTEINQQEHAQQNNKQGLSENIGKLMLALLNHYNKGNPASKEDVSEILSTLFNVYKEQELQEAVLLKSIIQLGFSTKCIEFLNSVEDHFLQKIKHSNIDLFYFESPDIKEINAPNKLLFLSRLNASGYQFTEINIGQILNDCNDRSILSQIYISSTESFNKVFASATFWAHKYNEDLDEFLITNMPKLETEQIKYILEYFLREKKEYNYNGMFHFIEKYGGIDFKDENNNNVLHMAIKHNNHTVIQYLIKNYPDLSIQLNKQNKTPIEYMFAKLNKNIIFKGRLQSGDFAEIFQQVLASGVPKSKNAQKQIQNYFKKYPEISYKFPEIEDVVFGYAKISALTKGNEDVEIKNKQKKIKL